MPDKWVNEIARRANNTKQRELWRNDPWFQIMQFLVLKRKAGLVLFSTNESRDRWQREHREYLYTNHAMFFDTLNTWRFEATFLYLCVVSIPEDMERLRGRTFDRMWQVDEIDYDYVRNINAWCLRQPPAITIDNNRKVLTSGTVSE